MFDVSFLEIENWVTPFLLPLFRVASFFMAVPLIGTQLVPVRIRLGLAILVTLLLVPVIPPFPDVPGFSLQIVPYIVQQMLVGSALGFLVQILLQIFVLGGQLIATQMGLGFASVSDPVNGVSVVVMSQFYLQLVMLLFVTMNGHLVMIDILAMSFEQWPIGPAVIPTDALWTIARSGSWMFSAALLMSLPPVTALLVVNFAFGIITKAAPQLNIFAVGFPFTTLMGLVITWMSLSGFLEQYQRFSDHALETIRSLLG